MKFRGRDEILAQPIPECWQFPFYQYYFYVRHKLPFTCYTSPLKKNILKISDFKLFFKFGTVESSVSTILQIKAHISTVVISFTTMLIYFIAGFSTCKDFAAIAHLCQYLKWRYPGQFHYKKLVTYKACYKSFARSLCRQA